MESKPLKPLAILNLAGELSPELSEYLSSRGVNIVNPEISEIVLEWTHLITKDIQDFAHLKAIFNTVDRDIKIISLSQVQNLHDFISHNGKLVFDEVWLQTDVGNFILDKFFQEFGGITLNDNYPRFQEKGAFNVTNPFNTGEYLDRMVHQAFESGVEALTIKTFFDHFVMYLAGLKTKGKIGFPIDITYGSYNDVFGVQLHFFANDLSMEDVTTSLSPGITKKAEQYLLNVAIQSCDFFDFTYLYQVNKVVVTGLWTKDVRVKFENRGLTFSVLAAGSAITEYATEGVTSTLVEGAPLTDFSDKIILNGSVTEEVSTNVSGVSLSEDIAQKVSGSTEIKKIIQILRNEISEDEESQLVSGLPVEVEGKVNLKSLDEQEDIVSLIKGRAEEETQNFLVSGGSLDVDNFIQRITSGLEDNLKDNEIMKVKALGSKLPESIKTGLFDFAKGLNKPMESLSGLEIATFKDTHIPEIIKSMTVISARPESTLKNKLAHNLLQEFDGSSMEEIFDFLDVPENEFKVKNAFKKSLKSTIEDDFEIAENQEVSTEEKEMLVKTISKSLSENEDKIRNIVLEAAQPTQPVKTNPASEKPLFQKLSSQDDKKLSAELKSTSIENDRLKGQVQALTAEVKTLKDAKRAVAELKVKAALAAKTSIIEEDSDDDSALRAELQRKLQDQKVLNELDSKKVKELLERETKLIEKMKQESIQNKRMQLETNKKEILFQQELEKSDRHIKAKDLIVSKMKDTLTNMLDRKDQEIIEVKAQLEQTSRLLLQGGAQNHTLTIRDLEKRNLNLTKVLEVYKTKVSSMASNMNSSKSSDDTSKDDSRKLQMLNNQMKNQVETLKKEVTRMNERFASDREFITSLKSEKARLEGQLKKATSDSLKEVAKDDHDNLSNIQELKKAQSMNHMLENQLKETSAKIKDLESKLQEAVSKPSKVQSGGDDGSKVKLAQLEGSLKKLTQDLVESRNLSGEMKKEINKLRQEKTALQNQIDRAKKDADKGKTATPKKSNGGKAA